MTKNVATEQENRAKHPSSMRKPKVISLFSGAGGLDYGFEAAGFSTAVALEMDRDACSTLRANRKWPVIEKDITQVRTAEILERGNLRKGDVDVLIGGPPCQPFSKAGYWARGDSLRLKDPRATTLDAYLRVVEETLPRAFLLENVEGLKFAGKEEGFQHFLDVLNQVNRRTKSNYRPTYQVVNAADFGVPQRRVRFVLVASREGEHFLFPKATHCEPDDSSSDLRPYSTAWDALHDLPFAKEEDLAVRGKWANLLPTIPEGENYLWHTDRGGGKPLFGWRRRYWSFLLKLAKRLPSWTIQAQPGPAVGPFHWDNRRLSARELCRLQTFPDDVTISGSRLAVQRQLGNAVPSLLAEILAREMSVQLLGRQRSMTPLKLLPSQAAKTPPARRTSQLPKEFLGMAGRHAAHPGTGLGRGAARRARDAAS